MLRPFQAAGWPADWRQVIDPGQLQSIAKAEGYSRILLVKSGAVDDASASLLRDAQRMPAAPLPSLRLQKPIPVGPLPLQDESWKKPYVDLRKPFIGPFPPDKFGGAGVPTTSFRLPSTVLPGEKRGGVAMKTDVVKGEPADTSELFGGGAGEKPTGLSQEGLFSPFLLFCASGEGK